MKRMLLMSAGLGLLLLAGGTWWGRRPAPSPATTAFATAASATEPPPQLLATGLISAGAPVPLVARVKGRVKHLYFRGGEYVRRGDVLVKLTNYSFVLAPHDGFLGPNALAVGQYLTPTTVVTTLSQLRTLVVAFAPRPSRPPGLAPGDTVRVWVAARPTRVVGGVVSRADSGPADSAVVVRLAPGAPFRIGERACVGQWTAALPVVATPAARP